MRTLYLVLCSLLRLQNCNEGATGFKVRLILTVSSILGTKIGDLQVRKPKKICGLSSIQQCILEPAHNATCNSVFTSGLSHQNDCGECLYCLDKPKYGGKGTKRQKCVRKRLPPQSDAHVFATTRVLSNREVSPIPLRTAMITCAM